MVTPENRYFRFNFGCASVNGFLMNVSFAVFGTATVLPVFVSNLTESKTVVALVSNLENAGWHLPQLFAAGLVLHAKFKMPLYRLLAVVRVGAIAAIIAAVVLVPREPCLLVSFILLFGVYSVAGGLAGVPFTDVVAKTVPMENRGVLFALRRFVGGILALLTAFFIIEPLLAVFQFPFSYAAVFGVGFVVVTVGLGVMSAVREPSGVSSAGRRSFSGVFRSAIGIFRADRNFRDFFFVRTAVAVNRVAVPFYIGLALAVLKLPAAAAGYFLGFQTAGFISSNVIWGVISRWRGSRLLLVLGAGISVLPPIFSLTAVFTGLKASWVFAVVFFTLGLSLTGFDLGSISYLMDISPEVERPVYIGTMNTLSGLSIGIAVAGGFLLERFGYIILFSLSVLGALAAVIIAYKLRDPFRESPVSRVPISVG